MIPFEKKACKIDCSTERIIQMLDLKLKDVLNNNKNYFDAFGFVNEKRKLDDLFNKSNDKGNPED
jgi:hypothetical protein